MTAKPAKRFPAVAITDGKRLQILVPYTKTGGVPNVIEIGSRTHRRRFKRTGKKTTLGEWIYREVKTPTTKTFTP